VRAKPAAAKGRYLLSITIATTMGPGVRVDESRTREGEILAGVGSADGDDAAGDGGEPEAEQPTADAEDAAEAATTSA
jgi:hypothetical protein